MCGNHLADGTPLGHHHPGPVFFPRPRGPRRWRRRAFLGEVGKGTVALAVLTPAALAACGDDGGGGSGAETPSDGPSTTSPSTTSTPPTTSRAEGETAPTSPSTRLEWARTDHGFVSSYVLVRGTEAAVVDTGVAGSAGDIGQTLADLGLSYADVRHVVLTHHHPDHIGSISEVLAMADGATAHAGQQDLDEIALDTINGLAGGEEIFGLEVLPTPGHTEGHVAVIDHDTGVLVAGDALNTADGGVLGPNPQFSTNMDTANASVRDLARLTFNTLLVGHGDPITDMADTAVADLAATL